MTSGLDDRPASQPEIAQPETVHAHLPHLLAACHPGDGDAWGVGVFTLDDLLLEPTRCTHFGSQPGPRLWRPDCRGCHLRRIRLLAANGWPPANRDAYPITVDVGFGDYIPTWPIIDGNHRVLAAWLRGLPAVEVMPAGDLDRAHALLVDGDDQAWWR